MSEYPSWQYDEMRQIGKDYDSLAEVEAYDARHGRFRNVEKENEDILESLDLRSDHVLIEFGSGMGAFAIQAAARCARVYAVDISRAMLEYAKKKAVKAGLTNMDFCHGGFLTYSHGAPPVDAIVTNTAFHHLPDFWKGVALQRLNGMLVGMAPPSSAKGRCLASIKLLNHSSAAAHHGQVCTRDLCRAGR